MNKYGHEATLVASHPGNCSRLVHGAYSGRPELALEDEALVEELMGLPHVVAADRLGVERVALLTAQLRRIEAALADGVVEGRRGNARDLVDVYRRLSAELREWLDRLGLTPKGRADWVFSLSGSSLADEIRRRLAEVGWVNGRAREAVLEAIVVAADATLGDRLKALELLREFDEDVRLPFAGEVDAVADAELEQELLMLLAPCSGGELLVREALDGVPSSPLAEIVADVFGPGVRFPDLARAVRYEIERRAEEIAGIRQEVDSST